MTHSNMRATPIFLIVLLLAGCSRDPAAVSASAKAASATASASASTPTAAKPANLAVLMAATFGKNYRPAGKDALADLPDPDDRKTTGAFVVTPVAATVLPSGDTVLVANAESADDKGNPMSSHASPGLLNVYFLRRDGNQWKVLRKHENIAALGSSGFIGEVKWLTLGRDKPGLGVLHGGTWQGQTIEILALFDLGSSELQALTAEPIRIHSDNDGDCMPESQQCWNVSGNWRFVAGKPDSRYDDLLVDFSGEKSQQPEDGSAKQAGGSARKTTRIQSSARYVFDGKSYRLASGENPVPEF